MKNGWKIAYLIVYDTIKYGGNTVHIKRFIYDYSRPFTAVLIQPGYDGFCCCSLIIEDIFNLFFSRREECLIFLNLKKMKENDSGIVC